MGDPCAIAFFLQQDVFGRYLTSRIVEEVGGLTRGEEAKVLYSLLKGTYTSA